MEERRIFTEKKMIVATILLVVFAIFGYIFLQYKDGGISLEEEKEQLEHIFNYANYVEETQTASETLGKISIFQKQDAFSQKNIEKTKQDYEKLLDVKVKNGNYKAITSVLEYKELSYFLFIFVCILLWYFFEDERIGQKVIFYASKNGRIGMFLWRVRALVCGIVGFTFITYASVLLLSFCIYGGWGDLKNPIQSVFMLKDFIYTISISEFLVGYVGLRIVTMLALAMVLWMGMLLFRNRKLSLLFLLLVFFMEGKLWNGLEEQSPYLFLKCWNVYNILYFNKWTLAYRNLKVGNAILNSFSTFLCYTFLLGLCATILCGVISVRRRPIKEKSPIEKVIGEIGRKISTIYHKFLSRRSVVSMECYKVFVLEKGWIAMTIWIVLLLSMLDLTEISYYGASAKMQDIYVEYSGEDIGKLTDYVKGQTKVLKREQKKYKKAISQYEKGKISENAMRNAEREKEKYEILSQCMDIINEKIQYMEYQRTEYGRNTYFLNDRPYEILFTDHHSYMETRIGNKNLKIMLILMLLVFLCSGLFSYDTQVGTEHMLRATKHGRGSLFWKKLGIMIGISTVLSLGTYCLDIYEVEKLYSFTCLDAPIQSLEFFGDFPLEMNCKTFFVLVGVVQLLNCIAIGFIISTISIYVKGRKGLLLNVMVILIPAAGYIVGIEELKYISVIQPMCYGNMLIEQGFLRSTILIVLQMGISGILGYVGMKKYTT